MPPLLWFGAIYLGSLLALLWQGFYTFDDFTMAVTPDLTLANLAALFTAGQLRHHPAHAEHGGRGVDRQRHPRVPDRLLHGALHHGQDQGVFLHRGDAADVGQLHRQGLRLDAAAGQGRRRRMVRPASGAGAGCCSCILGMPGVGGSSLSTSHLGVFLVFVYIWLPFMILPIQASLERVPPSLLQASADLGARPAQTFRR